MKSSMMIALVAGAAISTAASAQVSGHGKRVRSHAHPVAKMQRVGAKLDPIRVAGVRRLPSGQFMMTTPWVPYAHRGGTDEDMVPAFDCFEADASGAPTGFCDGGCSINMGCPGDPGNRWFFGPTYLNPDPTNDMTVVSGAAGLMSTRAEIAWNWGPTTPTECMVLLETAEDFLDCGGTAGGAQNYYDGVILDFGPLAQAGFYNYSDVDLSGMGLSWQLPMDGTGAYTYAFATAVDPTTGAVTIDTDPGTQPMLWGTGDAESPPDGRVGTQGPTEWDDDNPTDGMYDPALECYDLTESGFCPGVWGPMVLFYVDHLGGNTGCYANCDHSTINPFLNVNDFLCFQSKFAAGDSYANCDNSTIPPVLNVNDFLCFQSKFAAGCSAP